MSTSMFSPSAALRGVLNKMFSRSKANVQRIAKPEFSV